ncbi:ATP-binding protein [Leifsonia sp. EB34]|uniref:HAMP domain-containing sensor histidine kinase n=1 Tax=Leifsonia sp. EB34 TaxID=3156303 RepID=UPI00351236D4
MSPPADDTAGPAADGRSRRPSLTIRARLMLTFTGVVAAAGVIMAVAVSVFMRTVPSYVATGRTSLGGDDPGSSALLSLNSPEDILNATLVVSLVVLVLLVAVGAVLSWAISSRLLQPLKRINEAAQRAGSADFSQRIDLRGPHDELRDLADTFDDMLDRLHRTVEAHRRFAANASHELRTPLATTQTMLDVALDDPDADADTLRGVAERVRETNRRSIETVASLLDLAAIGSRPLAVDGVRLDAIVREAVEAARPELASRRIRIAVDSHPVTIAGETTLIRQAVTNLVLNAVRHNVDGGEIAIRVGMSDGTGGLRIQNTGGMIAADRVDDLITPFARGAGRTGSLAESVRGHGLGLAIVSSVVEAHRGTLRLTPRVGGGLTAELALPAGTPRLRTGTTAPSRAPG